MSTLMFADLLHQHQKPNKTLIHSNTLTLTYIYTNKVSESNCCGILKEWRWFWSNNKDLPETIAQLPSADKWKRADLQVCVYNYASAILTDDIWRYFHKKRSHSTAKNYNFDITKQIYVRWRPRQVCKGRYFWFLQSGGERDRDRGR